MNSAQIDAITQKEFETLKNFAGSLLYTVSNEERLVLALELSKFNSHHHVSIPEHATEDTVRELLRENLKPHYVLLLTKVHEHQVRLTATFIAWLIAERVWEWLWESLRLELKQYLDEQCVSNGYRALSRLWLERHDAI